MLGEIFKAFFITSIAGSALAVVITLLKPVTKRFFGYLWHYYVWLAVLLVMLFPVRFTFTHNSQNVPYEGMREVHTEKMTEIEQISEPINIAEAKQNINIPSAAELKVTDVITRVTAHRLNYMGIIWFAGMAAMLAIIIVGYIRLLIKIRKNSVKAVCPEISEYTNKKISVRISGDLSSPFMLGIFRPTLILPEKELDGEKLNNILRHEMTHFKRKDILYKWFAVIVRCVHWFNPIAYYVVRQINNECEISCDLSVTSNMNRTEQMSYIDTIISLVSENINKTKRIPFTTQMTDGKKFLKRRFIMIKNFKKTNKILSVISAAVTVMMLASALFASGILADTIGTFKEGDIEVFVNGDNISLSNKPFIDNYEVYVPLRETLNACGVPDENIMYANGQINMVIHSEITDSDYTAHINIGSQNITFDNDDASHTLVNGARTTTHPVLMRDGVTYIPVGMFSRIKQYDIELKDETQYTKGFRYNRALPVKLLKGLTARVYDGNGFDVILEDWTTADSTNPADYYKDGEKVIIGDAAHQDAQGYHYGLVNGYYYPSNPVKRIVTDNSGKVIAVIPVENQKHEAINGSGLSSSSWAYSWDNLNAPCLGVPKENTESKEWDDMNWYVDNNGICDPATASINVRSVPCFYIPVELIVSESAGPETSAAEKTESEAAYENAEKLSVSELKSLQESVDNGHMPWRLDTEDVITDFIHKEGLAKGTISGLTQTDISASADYIAGNNTYHIELFKPIKKDFSGIWVIKSIG